MDDDKIWADDEFWANVGVDDTMLEQEAIQAKIEAYKKIDEDIRNKIKPF